MSKPPRIRLPHEPMSRKSDFVLGALFSSVHVLLTTIIYHYVPEPYMDEVFHVGQTRSYCAGNYTWNPLITTPPALYIISMPFCGYERYVNSIIMFFAIPGFCRFRRMFTREDVWITATIVGMLPVLLHSSVLFYTDLLSLTTVIWAFTIRTPTTSALLFTIATLTRQTNIIWAAIYAFSILVTKYDGTIRSLVWTLLHLWPFELLALGFAVFIYTNNYQIVLGDAKAHQPKFHFAQLMYMLAFCAASSWTTFLIYLPSIMREMLDARAIGIVLLIFYGVYQFSYDHPYLLADNRHYTFYIWRRILSKPILRVSLAPVYLLSARFMQKTTHFHVFYKILFLVASFLVLVPAHLFEMRYYIISYAIFRLSATFESRKAVFIELFTQICIFSLVFVLFLFKTFEWESEPGIKQRFMF